MLAHLFVLVIVPLARRLSAVLTYLLVAALELTRFGGRVRIGLLTLPPVFVRS